MKTAYLDFTFDQSHSTAEPSAPLVDVYPDAPTFSANNESTEAWRLDRLAQTWGAACTATRLLSNRYRQHWNAAIISMRDHKGTLELTWRDEQSRIMFEGIIVGAWEHAGEGMASHARAD